MKRIADRVIHWYTKCVLDRPMVVIFGLVILIAILGYKAKDFKIDASAETLLLENDKDLRYTRQIYSRYGVYDFLLISFTPRQGDLFSEENLALLGRLRDEIKELPRTQSVMTILDVPLLESPPIPYSELTASIPGLQSAGVDKNLAREEFKRSPFYRDLIVSSDLKTTALVVNLKPDEVYRDLVQKRYTYSQKKAEGKLTMADAVAFETVIQELDRHMASANEAQHENILAVRAILDKYRSHAEIFLGGPSMISDDMISFIKKDLRNFGLGVFFLLVVMLGIIFRNIRWIVLPMLCCFLSVIAMMGVLGTFGWEVTVISSNFISLQLILTLAICVHLIVRYRELLTSRPECDQRTLVQHTIRSKFIPCLYAVLTTIAGFGSLLLCDIKPVIHFGWMMSAGIVLSLALIFFLFPAGLMLLGVPAQRSRQGLSRFSFTRIMARFTQSNGNVILAATIILSVISIIGISKLVVENSFIDYFKERTEIYQGMKVIDEKLGGTTPLDVIVQFEAVEIDEFDDEDDFFDTLEEPVEENNDKYWFLEDRMVVVEEVHDYLEALPQTGKVLSLGTLLKMGRNLNHGASLDSLEMAVLYTKLPEEFRKLILSPYLSIEHNETRFFVRIKDSLKSLKRDALLKQIDRDLINNLGLEEDKVHIAGTMVLYNNMLQSLFSSQIKTLGVVALALLLMFLVLFRSIKVALIALFPNLFAAGSVLGTMGWLNIPLDMMTITIAAISIGIAVDNTIHYIYRFREEISRDRDYYKALHRCHNSIGHAVYYTSITIIIGFSILVLSNFLPTIYFGLFTGLAMFIALVAALTILPHLLVLFQPFGRKMIKEQTQAVA